MILENVKFVPHQAKDYLVCMKNSGICSLTDRLVEYYIGSIEIIGKFNGIDGMCLIDDYGVQGGLVMSSDMWRKFFKGKLKKIIDCLEKHNLITHLHSCGNVTEIVADLVEVGV